MLEYVDRGAFPLKCCTARRESAARDPGDNISRGRKNTAGVILAKQQFLRASPPPLNIILTRGAKLVREEECDPYCALTVVARNSPRTSAH